jgi:hypothetical protein
MLFTPRTNPQFQGLFTKRERKGTVYIHRCNVNARNEATWFRLGIWKLRGMRRSTGKENVPHAKRKRVISIYCGTRRHTKTVGKWLNIQKQHTRK